LRLRLSASGIRVHDWRLDIIFGVDGLLPVFWILLGRLDFILHIINTNETRNCLLMYVELTQGAHPDRNPAPRHLGTGMLSISSREVAFPRKQDQNKVNTCITTPRIQQPMSQTSSPVH
jgi:hypothetical protein